MRVALTAGLILASAIVMSGAQESAADAAGRKTFDQILDLYVRDGYVYYHAQIGRASCRERV